MTDDNARDLILPMLRDLRAVIDARFDALTADIDARFYALNAQVGGIAIKLEDIALTVAVIEPAVKRLEGRLDRLLERVGKLERVP